MRRMFVAGNWKMNLDLAGARALASELAREVGDLTSLELAVCPPFVYIEAVAHALKGSQVKVGAQDVYFEEKGAFTGEVSPQMLLDVGCTYVIVGHSERRHVIRETDDLIARKAKAVLDAGLKVILCVGELLEEREAGKARDVVAVHIEKGLGPVTAEQMKNVVIAYEPVWAIGTGVNAKPADADEMHGVIRELLEKKYGEEIAQGTTIQYGGSVKPENAGELMGQPEVDGALVGGASLKAEPFVGIIRETIKANNLA